MPRLEKTFSTNKSLIVGLTILFSAFFSCSNSQDKELHASSTEVFSYNSESGETRIGEAFEINRPKKGDLREILIDRLNSAYIISLFPENSEQKKLAAKLKESYEDRSNELIWFSADNSSARADQLVGIIENIHKDGLNKEHYHFEAIKKDLNESQSRFQNQNPERLVELDLLLTSSYFILASDLLNGRLNPNKFDDKWIPDVRNKNLKKYFRDALEENEIAASLKKLGPKHPQYNHLKKALEDYRQLKSESDWHPLQTHTYLKTGDSSKIVPNIRNRLYLLGDLKVKDSKPKKENIFGKDIKEAVKRFQERHGLIADGIVGPVTLEHLNIPLDEKITRIKLNLERIRWLPESFGEKYILINIPEFRLKVYHQHSKVADMKVIVGKEYRSTPIFNDRITYLVFNPTWTLPLSIARRDKLEKIKEDPEYLIRNNYEVYEDWNKSSEPLDPLEVVWEDMDEETFNYRIVQKPGPWNALGQVKFMMKNDMAIYLHDTPTENLFHNDERMFSSGCIRVERPFELARFLLRETEELPSQKIEEYRRKEGPVSVSLEKDMPVYIIYNTVWVDEQGEIHFLEDIYKHDEMHLASLEEALDLN